MYTSKRCVEGFRDDGRGKGSKRTMGKNILKRGEKSSYFYERFLLKQFNQT